MQLQISAENVGGRNFTWRIEYLGNEVKNIFMAPGDHANHECLCVPMDMYIDYEVSDSGICFSSVLINFGRLLFRTSIATMYLTASMRRPTQLR